MQLGTYLHMHSHILSLCVSLCVELVIFERGMVRVDTFPLSITVLSTVIGCH